MTLFGFYLDGIIVAKIYAATEKEAREKIHEQLFAEFDFDDSHLPYLIECFEQRWGWPEWYIKAQQEVHYHAIINYQCC